MMVDGTKKHFTAIIGVRDSLRGLVCLEDVKTAGIPFKDHCWVKYDRDRFRNLAKGDKIGFTGILDEYMGIDDGGEQYTKQNITQIKSVQRKW